MKYDGKHGYGQIGSFPITEKSNPHDIVKHISKTFKHYLSKETKETGIKFNPYTYVTKDHGQLEIIKDMNGKVYGYDHGSYSPFGFQTCFI